MWGGAEGTATQWAIKFDQLSQTLVIVCNFKALYYLCAHRPDKQMLNEHAEKHRVTFGEKEPLQYDSAPPVGAVAAAAVATTENQVREHVRSWFGCLHPILPTQTTVAPEGGPQTSNTKKKKHKDECVLM